MAQMHGSLDAVGDGLARGWAQDLNDPLTPQVIEVFVDGELAVEGFANGFREDPREAGVGDGRAAFEIVRPQRLRDGQPHKIETRAGGTAALAGSPRILVWQPPFTARDFDARAPWIDHAE